MKKTNTTAVTAAFGVTVAVAAAAAAAATVSVTGGSSWAFLASSSDETDIIHPGSNTSSLKLLAASSTSKYLADDNSHKKIDKGDRTTVEGQVLRRQLTKPHHPYPLWDYNWDGRMTAETTLEAQTKSIDEPLRGGITRHIILVRHGQYHETSDIESERSLTPLGRLQAEKTGRRLRTLQVGIDETFGPCPIRRIYSSDMTRAKETASIIAKHLSHMNLELPDARLNEAIPAPIIPVRPDVDAEDEIDENRDRVEEAFRSYFYRSTATSNDEIDEEGGSDEEHQQNNNSNNHEFEVIVCHGNIIRYFFCRALQLPPEAWLRLSIFNCSMTYLMIKPNGYVSCRMLGDIGHLGYEESTFSMNHGFIWS